MSLVRWDPFRELDDMSQRLNQLFGRSGLSRYTRNGDDTMTLADWAPTVDIAETEREFLVKAELPEVKKEDVKVCVQDGILRIEGERRHEKEEKGKKYHRVERCYGSFLRSFAVPDNVDAEKVQAEFKDGILNVHLPKAEKAIPKAKEIKIN